MGMAKFWAAPEWDHLSSCDGRIAWTSTGLIIKPCNVLKSLSLICHEDVHATIRRYWCVENSRTDISCMGYRNRFHNSDVLLIGCGSGTLATIHVNFSLDTRKNDSEPQATALCTKLLKSSHELYMQVEVAPAFPLTRDV
jgi:hypothetical protein